MITAEEIRQKSFEKSMRGYRPEEVEAFLAQISATVEQLITDKAETEKKLFVMAEKVEEYRAQEETVKATLINAQRLGDNVIREANQKADRTLREAAAKAQYILDTATEREREEKENLKKLETEITAFKGNILSLYQQHIESLTQLDRQMKYVEREVFGEAAMPQEAETEKEEATESVVADSIEHAAEIADSYAETAVAEETEEKFSL